MNLRNGRKSVHIFFVSFVPLRGLTLETQRPMKLKRQYVVCYMHYTFGMFAKLLELRKRRSKYNPNHTLCTDFNIPYVSDVIHERIDKYHNKLEDNPIPLLEPLLQPINTKKMLAFRLARHLR
jgi:hypothetical protein